MMTLWLGLWERMGHHLNLITVILFFNPTLMKKFPLLNRFQIHVACYTSIHTHTHIYIYGNKCDQAEKDLF